MAIIELTQAQTNTLKTLADDNNSIGITAIAGSLLEDDGVMLRAAITESLAEHESLVALGFLQDVTKEYKDAINRMVMTLDPEHLRGRTIKVYSITETGRKLFTEFSYFIN